MFDYIIGNPPYQRPIPNSLKNVPIYREFTEICLTLLSDTIVFIIPASWTSGATRFRKQLTERGYLRHLEVWENPSDIFHDIEIAGGVCIVAYSNFRSSDPPLIITHPDKSRECKAVLARQQFAEVLTPLETARYMLSLLPPNFYRPATTLLEPACGRGVFLTEALALRHKANPTARMKPLARDVAALRLVATLYGLDIQHSNVVITRDALLATISNLIPDMTQAAYDACRYLITCNIVTADLFALESPNAPRIVISEWDISDDGYVMQSDYDLREVYRGKLPFIPRADPFQIHPSKRYTEIAAP